MTRPVSVRRPARAEAGSGPSAASPSAASPSAGQRGRGAPADRQAPPRRDRLPADSLAFALLGAARICVGVRSGRTLRDGLEAERRALQARPATERRAAPASKPPARPESEQPARPATDPQAAIHDLAARALRRRGRSDALLALVGQRVPDPPLLRELLVVSIALMVDAVGASGDAPPDAAAFDRRVAALPYSPFTLVDQAVEAASSEPDLARGKGFVNAVLRTLLRRMAEDPEPLRAVIDGPRATDTARYELPTWWVRRLCDAYPDRWPALVRTSLATPPLVVRVNRRRTTRDAYLERLADEGVVARAVGADGVRFDRAMPVSRIPGFTAGLVSVQDEAAQRAAPLLGLSGGMRVLDACAAPGGKTGHLLELADVDVTALDSDAGRLARVAENLERLGLTATRVTGDAANPASWWDGRSFDRILADVPCTASGILRRHPDIRWLRRETDVTQLSRTAQQITAALWSLLDPGGRLLLVTCSVFPEESMRHAEAFAARHPDAAVLSAPGQLLPAGADGGPDAEDHDGLFFALFEKMH